MQLTFQWRCATCEYEDDANPGFCPGCGAPAGPPTLAETWNRDHPGDPMLAAARDNDMVASASSKRARSPAPLVATRDRLAGGRHPAGRYAVVDRRV